MKVLNKTEKVINHLLTKKNITSLQAFKLYNATRLSAIIFNLREAGWIIKTETIHVKEGNTVINYAKYHFVSKG